MSEVVTGLVGGGTLVGLITLFYTIWKERNKNRQDDFSRSLDVEKSDLTLGEYFREVARREVELMVIEVEKLRTRLDEREKVCEQHTQQIRTQATIIAMMQTRYRAAELYIEMLIKAWGKQDTPPSPPENYKMGEFHQ